MRGLIVVFLALMVAVPASAQQWTSQEKEIIDHVKMCWDAWIGAQKDDGGPDAFFEKCPHADDSSMWWTVFGSPQTRDEIRRDWEFIRKIDLAWIDMRPIAVRIWGDVAMVQSYGYWKAKTPDGPVTTEFKRTELFRRVGTQWVFLGGQGTPTSAKDAEPYK